MSGDYITAGKKYSIDMPVNRRNKRLVDVITAFLFIIGFPVMLFLQKNPANFYKNVFSVLFRQKTWVGYAALSDELPVIRRGIITSTSLPAPLNELPEESLRKSDEWYAINYSAMLDLQKIRTGFKFLSY
jgi:hypothetical protein